MEGNIIVPYTYGEYQKSFSEVKKRNSQYEWHSDHEQELHIQQKEISRKQEDHLVPELSNIIKTKISKSKIEQSWYEHHRV